MGVSLTLVPEQYPNQSMPTNYVRLPLRRENHDMYDELRENAVPLGCAMMDYSDGGLIAVAVDDIYEEPLAFLNAGRLSNLLAKHMNGKAAAWDVAVLAFIDTLPKQTRVILWWH
jgi:hypothetical protein